MVANDWNRGRQDKTQALEYTACLATLLSMGEKRERERDRVARHVGGPQTAVLPVRSWGRVVAWTESA